MRIRLLIAICTLAAVSCLAVQTGPVRRAGSFDSDVQQSWAFAAQQLSAMTTNIPVDKYPITTNSAGAWDLTTSRQWTSGFFPGSLWLMYQQTGDPTWRTQAESRQAAIESQKTRTDTHDLGFMLFNSFGNGYRLTGNAAYTQTLLSAAGSLASRYNPNVGMIKSWDAWGGAKPTDYRVIIDNLMNLELLLWASKHGGKQEWRDMAVSHGLRAITDFVREDGSTYHVVNYDPATGAVVQKYTHQGYSAESTWARGQAWGIYGFTMLYRETGDQRFLEAARIVAGRYLERLPSDYVPYWDFDAPNIPDEPRDSSAAAVAASGLLELWRLESDTARKVTYRTAAENTLSSLASPTYLAQGTANQAILLHGTYHKPAGQFDTGTTWGDYYFLEAMLRLRWLPPNGLSVSPEKATASSHNGNPPANAIDNDSTTFWAAEGEDQWLQLDLGFDQSISALQIGFQNGISQTAQIEIQALRPDGTWKTAWQGLSSGTTVDQETYAFAPQATRAVRIVIRGSTNNQPVGISEVDLYAALAQSPTATPTPTPTTATPPSALPTPARRVFLPMMSQ